jgi:ATP phosphoribosyltransferase regulatory subunit
METKTKLPQRARKLKKIAADIEKILSQYGYTEVYLPLYEYYDILSKTAWNFSDENIIRFIDRNTGKSMVLRPDFTPQVCRNVANYMNSYPKPIRLSYKGRVFRNVNVNKGLKSEMQQIGIELFGEEELYGDLELIAIGYKGIESVGIEDFKIVLTDIYLLKECLSLVNNKEEYLNLLKAKNYCELKKKFNSGELSSKNTDLLEELPKAFGGIEVLNSIKNKVSSNTKLISRLDELLTLYDNMISMGIPKVKIVFDLAEVNGINYYTGINVRFVTDGGNVLISGGRYDNLMHNFGVDVSACGLAFNLEEILPVYELRDEKIEIDYLVIGRENFKRAEELRKKDFKVLWVSDKGKLQNLEVMYSIKNIFP